MSQNTNTITDLIARQRNILAGKTAEPTAEDLEAALKTYEKCRWHGIRVQPCDTHTRLLRLHDGKNQLPMVFIKSGTPSGELFKGPALAVAGSRNLTGNENPALLKEIISNLPDNVRIITGLAFGTEQATVEYALDRGLKITAVCATGLDDVYPTASRGLAERIAATPGCALVSPFLPDTAPLAVNFFLRNRVKVLLSDTVLVLAMKSKGSGMMTARIAFMEKTPVIAVPGHPLDDSHAGCNQLIKENIADIYTDITDITEKLLCRQLLPSKERKHAVSPPGFSTMFQADQPQ